MVLLWTFDFIRASQSVEGGQRIIFSQAYENGRPTPVQREQELLVFLAYIAQYPGREITKIKVAAGEHSNQYALYYIYKRLDSRFIGILGVSETNVPSPVTWGAEELMATYIFDYYQESLMEGRLNTGQGVEEYRNWLHERVHEFFEDWCSDTEHERVAQIQQRKVSLAMAFQRVGSGKSGDVMVDMDPEVAARIDRTCKLQLINEFGSPVTDVTFFKNGTRIPWGTVAEQSTQSMESMSLSMLQTLTEMTKKTHVVKYIKLKLSGGTGHAYLFFHPIKIAGTTFLILGEYVTTERETGTCLQAFLGDEETILRNIGNKLAEHPEWFKKSGDLAHDRYAAEVEKIFEAGARRLMSGSCAD
jgi:hypothetical protein